MKKLRIISTKLKSQSLKRVANHLTTLLNYKVWCSSKIKPNRSHIRYGDQVDKVTQYQWFAGQGIPALEFTTKKEEAQDWQAQGILVVCRALLRSSEGKGITLVETGELPTVPVYTKYRKKKKEFRVHVFKDKVVHVLEKRKRKGFEDYDTKIRNSRNGWVFCSDDVIEPNGLRELALSASRVTSSDFRGVDIGYNELKDELFVIEVNSAPGIEGTNVDRYCQVILGEFK